ncbi:GNAT family N-acetyltransferase [Hahella sp. SMD15-11]|uniref:GNAT family N-acetyltransferase n=1 Tax=Thermohahella caldifontis TaxID=3142973 RepID=A0AB39US92_9GAMM
MTHNSDSELASAFQNAPGSLVAQAKRVDAFFQRFGVDSLQVPEENREDWIPLLSCLGVSVLRSGRIDRALFYQLREPWLSPALWPVTPYAGLAQSARAVLPDGVVYERHVAALGGTLSLRCASVTEDGERFWRWQNEPRVSRVWEYAWPRKQLDDYLRERLDDPHSMPLIACLDEHPFGYVEAYWAQEDRLGDYYDAQPWDAGFHLLVGEAWFLGRGRAIHLINGISHFLFLLDPRTGCLVGEPRADNAVLLRYLSQTAWYKEREFDFPHKRAALVKCDRLAFFHTTRL